MMSGRLPTGRPAHYFLFTLSLAAIFTFSDAATAHSSNSGHVLRRQQLTRQRSERILASLAAGAAPPLSTPQSSSSSSQLRSRVYSVMDYGADPRGIADSTQAIKRALADACASLEDRRLMSQIADLGGSELNLGGGSYLISSPLTLPSNPIGNIKIHQGTLRASDDFPAGRYIIELGSNSSESTTSNYNFEFVTLSGLMIDANHRAGGIIVINSLRTTISGCYIVRFTSEGISVRSGHETLITNSFIGQQITAGAHPQEKSFTGTGISLTGNDNIVTDVVIFSAAIGILIAGPANILTGVHCYNKASAFGGMGIYLKSPGLTQTRIVNCYLDYNSIVSEDPVQLHVSGTFFLGDANVVLKSVKGVLRGINIVENVFSGLGGGVDIVRLDESGGAFTAVDQVMVGRNSVEGMRVRSTVGKASVRGNGTTWTVDFSPVLLFPNRIDQVQYSLLAGSEFPKHALRKVSDNRVVIESDVAVQATVYAHVEQYGGIMA
ncbi:polygalacturonase QRT3-like [Phalaenopsis equestris]|uniref:polygalacturonase QRT3-like n=1 Tax=Phalaenopsis equestris TaxID=78828 RepID=UPI0009E3FB0D|nr:polygalacturonase QRT3-like [Phalaenopsis equestris]